MEKTVPTPRILVVEDDAEMRDLLSDELSEDGYEVTQAENGEEAAEKLSHAVFDVIITDIRMPKVSGMELLTSVTKTHSKTPVIMITAFGNPDTINDASEKGAFDYLGKPFKIQDLKNTVKRALTWDGRR
jgi:two-component system, NtrC family, response regulator PilR